MPIHLRRTIAGSPRRFQAAGAAALLLALTGCSMWGQESPPEVHARWAAVPAGGPAQILVTARATTGIAAAEALGPNGEVFAATLPARNADRHDADRDYGVAVHGSSDTGLSLGLSLDSLARAFRPPERRRSAVIPLPPATAAAYRRSWRDWQVAVRFAGGPTVVQAAPEPRD